MRHHQIIIVKEKQVHLFPLMARVINPASKIFLFLMTFLISIYSGCIQVTQQAGSRACYPY